MSGRSQKVLVWWAVVCGVAYGLSLRFLLHMMPPPTARWSADQVAQFYAEHSSDIKWGATVCSWTAAFMIPLTIVVALQMSRHEKGKPLWSFVAGAGGVMMSIFLVLPPIFWGVAAFTPTRAPEITATMHELATLTFVTTDQYYIFLWVAIAIVCLIPHSVPNSPFTRWFGYFTIWCALMFEAGAIAFLTRSGPFAWNGLLVYWSPLLIFSAWLIVFIPALLKAIDRQTADSAAGATGSDNNVTQPAVLAGND